MAAIQPTRSRPNIRSIRSIVFIGPDNDELPSPHTDEIGQ